MKGLIIGLGVLVVIIVGVLLFKNTGKNVYTNMSPTSDTGNQPTTQENQNTIFIKNFSFNPNMLTIKRGTTITWTNQDSVIHTIKSDSFNSNDLKQGDKFQFTFTSAGTFNYSCGIHPNMKGTIVVE